MFRLFPSRNRNRPTRLRSEDELLRLKMNDDYDRTKSFKDFITLLAKIVFSLLVAALVYEYITNNAFSDFIIKTFQANISGILLFILSIIGVNQLNKKR